MKEHEIAPNLTLVDDDNGRLFLYCRGCHEHKPVGDGLEFKVAGRVRGGWLAVSTALRHFRTIGNHLRCGEDEK